MSQRGSRNALALARAVAPPVRQEFIAFKGGLDLETPPLFLPSGAIRGSQNYECDVLGGYRTVVGYERHDGRPSPSAQHYAVINLTITGAFAVGNTITGGTSAATAVVLAVVAAIGTTSAYLVITKIVGVFVTAEALKVAAVTQGTSSSGATVDGASTPLLHAQYNALAADNYRADIGAIPGSGDTLGVIRFNGVTYGFRNNAGATAAAIYKSSGTGWTLVPLGETISFTVGAVVLNEGATLTQGGVTATVKRVVILSGSVLAGTAAGRLTIFNRAGGNFAGGAATTTGGGTLTLSGAQSAIAILPNGFYKFIVENFGGSTGTKRIYGIDGANKGFEFDGTDYSYTPIVTGMANDIPTNIIGHTNHLFFSFPNGSVQFSGSGTPYIWTPLLGAAEIAIGNDVTGFLELPGSQTAGALAIFARDRSFILYGTGATDFVLVPYRKELGAFANSMQDIGFSLFLDNLGVVDLQTVQYYGNFISNTLTQRVRTWLNTEKTKVACSCVSRDKSQYRLYFNDQYALYITFAQRKVIGMTQIFFANAPKNVWSSKEADGTESIYFGGANGFVYQMEKGTSHDGADIETWLYLAYDNIKEPRMLKHYHHAMLEVTGVSGYAAFSAGYSLGYGDANISQPMDTTVVVSTSAGVWDAPGAVWDALFWDGAALSKQEFDLGGTAENISLMFHSKANYYSSLRFSGAMVGYTQRRSIR